MSGREAKRNDERLYYKFLVKYFENLHEDIYDEADKLYEETKKLNPKVKDLTKTAQFMDVVTPNIPVPRYYHNRQLKSYTTTTHRGLQEGPQMVLHIPLHKLPPPPAPTADMLSLTIPVPPQPSPPTTTTTADMPSLTIPVPPQPSQPIADMPSPPATPPLLIPEALCEQLLTELLADPNMAQIMNDFPFSEDKDDDMNMFVQADFTMDDISPLEAEMNTY